MARGELPTERKRQERVRGVTLRQAFADYLAVRTLEPKTVTEYRRALEVYLSDWSERPITQITRTKVLERFQRLASERVNATANAVMRGLRAVLNFAQHHYGRDDKPLFPVNPVQALS
ncbi:site-specific integrase, partial [Acidithiobacillus sp.]|uniref:site-specific integrase n=1 Tax=Acidithiobacillus sp. TaxID=1872118 RepID=UPI0025BED390